MWDQDYLFIMHIQLIQHHLLKRPSSWLSKCHLFKKILFWAFDIFFCKSFDQYHIVILIHLFNHSIWCSRLWPHSSVLPWLSLNFHINYRISLISKNKPRWDFHCQYRLIWRTDIFQYCLPIMNMVYPSYWGLFCYISDTFNGITNGNVLSFIF